MREGAVQRGCCRLYRIEGAAVAPSRPLAHCRSLSYGEGTPVADRADRLADLPDEWIECRALGHDDEIELGYGVRDDEGRIQANWAWLKVRCRRCGRTQERYYDAYFMVIDSPAPKYPDGYLLQGAGLGPWRREARAELWRRRAGEPTKKRKRR
jgi:hypothetical protein